MTYQFKLREDMPPGFIENPSIPELPAARNYLAPLDGKIFKDPSDFRRELSGFADYLKRENIPAGVDSDVRKGIFLFDNGAVGTHADGISERCEFGRLLERIVN